MHLDGSIRLDSSCAGPFEALSCCTLTYVLFQVHGFQPLNDFMSIHAHYVAEECLSHAHTAPSEVVTESACRHRGVDAQSAHPCLFLQQLCSLYVHEAAFSVGAI
jgi:hypothetical protein